MGDDVADDGWSNHYVLRDGSHGDRQAGEGGSGTSDRECVLDGLCVLQAGVPLAADMTRVSPGLPLGDGPGILASFGYECWALLESGSRRFAHIHGGHRQGGVLNTRKVVYAGLTECVHRHGEAAWDTPQQTHPFEMCRWQREDTSPSPAVSAS